MKQHLISAVVFAIAFYVISFVAPWWIALIFAFIALGLVN